MAEAAATAMAKMGCCFLSRPRRAPPRSAPPARRRGASWTAGAANKGRRPSVALHSAPTAPPSPLPTTGCGERLSGWCEVRGALRKAVSPPVRSHNGRSAWTAATAGFERRRS
eukprot:97858-Chlamydomonas_euryale.AAC.5